MVHCSIHTSSLNSLPQIGQKLIFLKQIPLHNSNCPCLYLISTHSFNSPYLSSSHISGSLSSLTFFAIFAHYITFLAYSRIIFSCCNSYPSVKYWRLESNQRQQPYKDCPITTWVLQHMEMRGIEPLSENTTYYHSLRCFGL